MRHPTAVVVSCLKKWFVGSEYEKVHVATKVPANIHGPVVRVDSAPPNRETPITDRTRIMLQAYGDDDQDCVDLLAACLDGLEMAYRADVAVMAWETDTEPYNFPDPDRPGVVRWQAAGTLWTALS